MDPPPTFPLPDEAREPARRALTMEVPLCLECRGRFFGRVGHGWTNSLRAVVLSEMLSLPLPELEDPLQCSLCHGAFHRLEAWVGRAEKAAAGHEWRTFLCGSRWEPADAALEESLWTEAGTSWGESMKIAFNREFGKAVSARTGREFAKEGADLLFLADVPIGAVQLEVFSLYVTGRYLKHDRTIPQTRWPCRRCRGRGCDHCGGTGKQYPTSVEELVAGPLNEMAGGQGHRFHGMGREDIDARMLGDGRPFVAEVLSPRVRTLDLAAAAALIAERATGRVEVRDLAYGVAADVVRVKESAHDKTYRVVILGSVPEAKIKEAIPLLAGAELQQRTPARVSHRRADLVRRRTIREVQLMEHGTTSFTLRVRAQAGTYIKEFVDGDGGRTIPSLSSMLGQSLKVEALDVLAVHDREESRPW